MYWDKKSNMDLTPTGKYRLRRLLKQIFWIFISSLEKSKFGLIQSTCWTFQLQWPRTPTHVKKNDFQNLVLNFFLFFILFSKFKFFVFTLNSRHNFNSMTLELSKRSLPKLSKTMDESRCANEFGSLS